MNFKIFTCISFCLLASFSILGEIPSYNQMKYLEPTKNSKFLKLLNNPLIAPKDITLEGYKINRVYNPTVTEYNNKYYMIIRTEGKNTKTGILCLAESEDGKNFKFTPKNPIIKPDNDYDELGCEDPRIVKFDDTYYLFYFGNNKLGPAHICLATSKNLLDWKKYGLILQPKNEWEHDMIKAPGPLPTKVNGKYYMYYLGQDKPWHTSIGLAESEDLIHWKQSIDKPVLTPRDGFFDSYGVEPGACIMTPKGILLIDNGWDADGHINKTSWCLYNKNDPAKLIYRADEPLISIKDQHVFTTGLYNVNGQWLLYWGAADAYIAGGVLNTEALVNSTKTK